MSSMQINGNLQSFFESHKETFEPQCLSDRKFDILLDQGRPFHKLTI